MVKATKASIITFACIFLYRLRMRNDEATIADFFLASLFIYHDLNSFITLILPYVSILAEWFGEK